jgi:nicotinate phosphoribosyltransferase
MDDWFNRYGEDLSIALTDTFTSDFFFSDFPKEQAKLWRGLRHDSGDPFEFGNKAIEFYEQLGIDPKEKTIVFSDGLDIETIVKLADYFDGKINVLFGWGTTLMNDLGLRANNIVMKVTNVNGIETVKLSDDEGKHTGSAEKIGRYILAKDRELARV